MHLRTRALMVGALMAATVATTTGTGLPALAAPNPSEVRLVAYSPPTDEFLVGAELTPDGRFALLRLSTVAQRLDLTTGAVAAPPEGYLWMLSDDGLSAYAVQDSRTLVRYRFTSGALDTFTVPFQSDWALTDVVDADAAGRFVLLEATSGAAAQVRAFMFDTTTLQVIGGDAGLSLRGHSRAIALSDDGRYVTYEDIENAGIPSAAFVTWDRTIDARREVLKPAEQSTGIAFWTVSPDLSWVLFAGSSPGIVPGLDGADRLYRRNLATGVTDAVPISIADVNTATIRNGGRVVLSYDLAIGTQTTVQVAAWDGGPAMTLLSRAANGAPADRGVDRFLSDFDVTDDGSLASFVSFSTNLPGGGTPDVRRLHTVAMAPVGGLANPAGLVAAGGTMCVRAVGAAPGDFVGVNITPVSAQAPGFGTLHSSDDQAGSTSNVNFGLGTVDPNVAFTKVGSDGRICFTNSIHSPVHVIIDEMIVADASAFRAPSATGAVRLADTRTGLGGPIVQPSETRCVPAIGASPGEFVGLNVLPLDATRPGFGTIHASGTTPGASSTANFGPGSFDPNFAFTEVGADGGVCFTNSELGPVHLVLDELIVSSANVMRRPTAGASSDRPVDTRTNVGGSRLGPNGRVCFGLPGSTPGDFGVVNLLAVEASGPGFATLHSSSVNPGSTSNVNYTAGSFDPNMGIAAFGTDNQMCLTNGPLNTTDVIVDAQVIASGAVFAEPTGAGSVRLVDSRIFRP